MPLAREQRKLAAIVAADVVGYSRLMGRDESGTLARLRKNRSEHLDPVVTKYGGRLVKLTGDGALIEFASAVDALSAAIEFQQAMAAADSDQPEDAVLVFRLGLHLGDVLVEGDDIYGDGVNVAARLEAEAPAGGILISRSIRDAVAGRVKATFEDLGGLSLKNIERPVRAFRVLWSALDWQPLQQEAITAVLVVPDKPSVAVLPFVNMTGDPEQEYFVDGLVEDIITALSRFKSLFVIARNSSFTFSGEAVDIKQVGRELGVRYVLEGSVRKAGSRVRITSKLIEAETKRHLWADNFNGSLEDVFGLQDKVTTSVVGLIAPEVEKAEIERAMRKPTERLDSHDLLMRGMNAGRKMQFEQARALFGRAFELDPECGEAAALAAGMLVSHQALLGFPLSIENQQDALRLANIAARVSGDDASVLARSGHVLAYLGHEYDRGMAMVDRAVALNANLSIAWLLRGFVAGMCGKHMEAIESFQRLLRLSPLDPSRALAWNGISFGHFMLGEYEKGCEAAMTSMQSRKDVHSLGAYILNAVSGGHEAKAKEAAAELLTLHPQFRASQAREVFPNRLPDAQDYIGHLLRLAGLPE